MPNSPETRDTVSPSLVTCETELRDLLRRANRLQARDGRIPDSLRDSIKRQQRELHDLRKGQDGRTGPTAT
jgi:hypothetical protein